MSSPKSVNTERDQLGFDPDSPDVKDPQVDPTTPAKPPETDEKVQQDKRVKDADYPPYKKD